MGVIYAAGSGDEMLMLREILASHPYKNVLLVGYADSNVLRYYDGMKRDILGMTGGNTEALDLEDLKDSESARRKIKAADLYFVQGGNTLKLMKRLRRSGIDTMLAEEFRNTDKVFSGASAGGICWFDFGCADSLIFKRNPDMRVRVKGLGLYPLLFAPHYHSGNGRALEMERMVREHRNMPGVGLGSAALVIDGKLGMWKTLPLSDTACSERGYMKNGEYILEDISTESWKKLDELLKIR